MIIEMIFSMLVWMVMLMMLVKDKLVQVFLAGDDGDDSNGDDDDDDDDDDDGDGDDDDGDGDGEGDGDDADDDSRELIRTLD